mgnify:CR=1 FL=1
MEKILRKAGLLVAATAFFVGFSFFDGAKISTRYSQISQFRYGVFLLFVLIYSKVRFLNSQKTYFC